MKKSRFRKRYVLGEGWPWYEGPNDRGVGMCASPKAGTDMMKLNLPFDVLNADGNDNCPKYRLVLERIS